VCEIGQLKGEVARSGQRLAEPERGMHEGTKLVNRIEDARAERLLMEIERGKG
jgi:hypothetical protein